MQEPCLDLGRFPGWVVVTLSVIGAIRLLVPLVRFGGSSWSARKAQKRRTRQGRNRPH